MVFNSMMGQMSDVDIDHVRVEGFYADIPGRMGRDGYCGAGYCLLIRQHGRVSDFLHLAGGPKGSDASSSS